MKTVTQFIRENCITDTIIEDDVTGTRSIIRECDDGDEIVLESLENDVAQAA